jgi:hypothetical protein
MTSAYVFDTIPCSLVAERVILDHQIRQNFHSEQRKMVVNKTSVVVSAVVVVDSFVVVGSFVVVVVVVVDDSFVVAADIVAVTIEKHLISVTMVLKSGVPE